MRLIIIILLMATTLFSQDIIEDIDGTILTGKLIDITETHIIFLLEGDSTSKPFFKRVITRVTLSDGTIAYEKGVANDSSRSYVDVSENIDEYGQRIPSIEESIAKLTEAHQTIATVYVITLCMSVGLIVISILIALN